MGGREDTWDVELETLFTEVAQRKDEMDRARVVWREASDRVATAQNKRIGQGTADAYGYDHVLARIARNTLAAIEGIGEGGDGAS